MPILTGPEPLTPETTIRPARPGEEDAVLDLLAEAAAWLAGRGIHQWPQRFPRESVRHQIQVGEALLIIGRREPIATCVVTEADPELWGVTAESAYYLGRLAVARKAAGAGPGNRIIDWIGEKAAARGKAFVRVATTRDHPALRGLYARAGFEHVADPPAAEWPTSLYQRRAAVGP
ncbi:GNAT family N-acetyltransferase [Amycolatopsis decaplanina]|uniref:Acetyltransferase (GNAT) family protein n=1 Tax=Amycolatopsis decaplanina DSM 44594 TaxID=1284240 RepID=M2XC86_9PSEU|nr:GNAT family N-acetyltransferase [Amycolatopsis decaplanina]EME58716.1 acetyltransferase (GNAT) family protein [Amycolatopsis decaplanina DSM 44594]